MATHNRHAQITATDHGPLVNIAAWTMMCMSILFTAFRLISSIVLRGTAGKDDWVIVVATAFASMQVVATSLMVANGLGLHQDSLQAASIESYQRALLTSTLLYVVSLAFSRLSILIFLGRLISIPQRRFRLLMNSTIIVVLLYLVVQVLCLSLACDFPATWDYINGRCVDVIAFWDFDTAFDIATSLAVIAAPISIIGPLQMSSGRKLKAISAFAFQIPLCGFAAIRLTYLHRALRSQDQTWNSVDWQIWTQINLHFSIVAANMPCLNVFLEGFQSVLFRQNIGGSFISQTELRSYPHTQASKGKNRGGRRSISGSTRAMVYPQDGGASAAIQAFASCQPDQQHMPRSDEIDGRIYKTTEWTVLEADDNVERDDIVMF